MNRHLRNFSLFALAFTLTLLAGFASAANIKLSGPNSIAESAGSYSRGDGLSTTFTKSSTPAPSEVLSDSKVLMKRVFDVGGETANGKWSGVLIDAMEVPKATLATRLKDAVKLGLKPGPLLGGIALQLAADWMIQKGFEWMNDATNWVKPGDPTYPYLYKFPNNLFNNVCQGNVNMDISAIKACALADAKARGYPAPWGTPFVAWQDSQTITIKTTTGTNPACGCNDNLTVANKTGLVAPKTVATSAELDATMDDLATQKLKEVADAMMNDASTLPIPDDAKTTPTGGPYTTPIRDLGSTNTTNPDGSRTVEGKQGQDKVTPQGGATPAAPITFKTEQVITTTTNNYNIDNSVRSSSSSTSTKPAGTDEQKTDCDKKPTSVGCADMGTPPADPNLGQQTVNPSFTWSPFSLPATCPAPQTISTSRGHFTLSWQPECDFATMLRPLVIAFAGLGALYVAFGMKNDG